MTGSAGRFKSGLVLLLLIAASIGLGGCWDRKEVNDLALIMGAGLDLSEKGKLELSVQVFVAKQSGGEQQSLSGGSSGGGAGAEQTVVFTATGDTIAEAATKLQELLPRKVFWGHDEAYIIGESLAEHGITDQTDFLLRHPGPRLGAYVFVSKGKARDVMEQPSMLERNVSESLREMAKAKTGLSVRVKDLMQMLRGESRTVALPMVMINQNRQSADRSPYLSGTAVLKNGKMIGRIGDYTTRGVMWVKESIKESVITFRPRESDGYVSAHLIRSRSRLTPSIRGDEWAIRVRITSQANLVQNESSLDPLDPRQVKQIEKSLNDEISDRIERALRQAQQQLDADVFGFADVFRRSYPKQWKRARKDWDELFPRVKVTIEPDIRLERPGFSGK